MSRTLLWGIDFIDTLCYNGGVDDEGIKNCPQSQSPLNEESLEFASGFSLSGAVKFLLNLDDLFVRSDAATFAEYIAQGVGDMQTRLGAALSLVVAVIATALAWTGRLTGWFDPENIVSPSWGYLALGTLLALGVVRLIDRRVWVVRQRPIATREMKFRAAMAARYERWRLAFVAMLNEPIVAPPSAEPAQLVDERQAAAQ